MVYGFAFYSDYHAFVLQLHVYHERYAGFEDQGFPDPSGKSVGQDLIYYLPLGTRTIEVYDAYVQKFTAERQELIEANSEQQIICPIAHSTFKKYWRKFAPFIQISHYKTDMCNTCHQFLIKIRKERRMSQGFAFYSDYHAFILQLHVCHERYAGFEDGTFLY